MRFITGKLRLCVQGNGHPWVLPVGSMGQSMQSNGQYLYQVGGATPLCISLSTPMLVVHCPEASIALLQGLI